MSNDRDRGLITCPPRPMHTPSEESSVFMTNVNIGREKHHSGDYYPVEVMPSYWVLCEYQCYSACNTIT